MNPRVTVGIHVHTDPDRLIETVRSVGFPVVPGPGPVLLVDGAEPELAAALAAEPTLARLRQLADPEPRGAPALFNKLASLNDDDAIVFIESGTLLGPKCIDLLIEALKQPGRGLTGPSTNRSWNQQGVFRSATSRDLVRTAALARRRFGSSARSLEPLHSLADFCLAVSREVIDAIGGADEAYGQGPCWEMDYNIRAARSGFRGVWVGGAYAYRHPPSVRRQRSDAELMAKSKRLYQDRFCGLRLTGQTGPYEEHCRGEACQDFAPLDRIRLQQPTGRVPTPRNEGELLERKQALLRKPAHPAPAASVAQISPLVSAIMPTRGRADLALQAVQYFLAQDYEPKEIVVLEDGAPTLSNLLPDDGRVRYVATGCAQRSIGAMRNEACRLARGDIVAHWDDDDWYGHERLSRQVAAIRAGDADITALRDSLVFELGSWRFWRLTPELHRKLFVRDVHGGTLVYRRQVWKEKAQFPDRSIAEDAIFLDQAVRRGARLTPVEADGIFVYVRHEANAWKLTCGVSGLATGWQAVPEPDFPPAARAFYAARSPAAPTAPDASLVSCVMPTFNRRPFVKQAVHYFLQQDYPRKELVVVDDGPEPVDDLLPADERVLYHRVENRMVLGAKRNLACEVARGPVIVHWDDDDWASRNRLSVQVDALSKSDAEICGTGSILYFNPARCAAWRFVWPDNARPWAAGPSLCFTKDFWKQTRFPEVAIGEDTRFVFSPTVRGIADVREANCVVGIIHPRNTAAKSVQGHNWKPRPVSEVERLLGEDMTFYRELAKAGSKT